MAHRLEITSSGAQIPLVAPRSINEINYKVITFDNKKVYTNKLRNLKTKNILYNRPFILGRCTKAYKLSPKKPNSAERKVVSLIVLEKKKRF